jgi:hypothetical protein
VQLENLKAYTHSNSNDMSLMPGHMGHGGGLHYNNQFNQLHPVYYHNTNNVQNVQKIVLSINTQFSKIFVNSGS